MDVVNVRQLKNNPSEALRNAAKAPVLVMKGDQPTALIVSFGGDPAIGDPDNGVEAGTAFEDLPADWVCPECGVGTESFEAEE